MALLWACAVHVAGLGSGNVVLPPPAATPKSATPVAVVLLQGAQIDASAYTPLLQSIQAAAVSSSGGGEPLAVWAAAPQVTGSVVNPVTIGGSISQAISLLSAAGMPNGTALFLAGHSLGGAMLELYAHDHGVSIGAKGAIFMGAFVARKHRDPATGVAEYPLPTLTLAGELDGLARVTRTAAEAYYTQVTIAADPEAAARNAAVAVLPGVSHMQFASGTPPLLVKERDLRPEVSLDAAHSSAAALVVAFLRVQVVGSSSATAVLMATSQATATFTAPIIAAYQLEGSKHLHPQCNSDFPTNPTCSYPKWPDKCLVPGTYPHPPSPPITASCTCGSPWVMHTAHTMMAGFDKSPAPSATVESNDAFHDVSDVRPFHLPHIFNKCTADDSAACTLNVTTVDMPIWETLEAEDTGFISTSAIEMRVKMKSREALWQAAGISNVNSTETDLTATICRDINQAAIDWAVAHAGPNALARYNRVGQKYTVGLDVNSPIGITGPTWIKKQLQYNQVPPAGGTKSTVQIRSPFFFVKNKNNGDEPFTDPVGMHYCKLLSPARAIEWIYVDSLRYYDSIANMTVANR